MSAIQIEQQSGMAVPTALPTEAVPLDAARKRRHSEAISNTGDRDATAAPSNNRQHRHSPSSHERKIEDEADDDDEDDDDEEDDKSLFEDLLDGMDDRPYINDGSMGIDDTQLAEWRRYLLDHGPDKFFEEMINVRGIEPKKLGMAFNLDPSFDMDEEAFLRLFGLAVVRFFYKRRKLQDYNSVDDAAKLLQRSQKIIVITGAGISTSLGIPDFRSKNSGFYAKVQQMGYDEPQEVFDIKTFDVSPELFYNMAHMVLPDDALGVSPTHAFIRLLQDRGILQRNYTQNIDDLEGLAGLRRDKIVQCHGSFATATCRKCKDKVDGKEIYDDIRAHNIPTCKVCLVSLQQPKAQPRPQKRSRFSYSDDEDDTDDDIPQPGVMKPDITFFGEQLPDTFFDRFTKEDAKEADLVIVIGTSLKVAPVSEMPNFLPHETPHIYISLDPIKHVEFDIQLLGKCDDVVVELCRRAGWDLQHDKISSDALHVEQSETFGHHWKIGPKEREIADSVDGQSQELAFDGSG